MHESQRGSTPSFQGNRIPAFSLRGARICIRVLRIVPIFTFSCQYHHRRRHPSGPSLHYQQHFNTSANYYSHNVNFFCMLFSVLSHRQPRRRRQPSSLPLKDEQQKHSPINIYSRRVLFPCTLFLILSSHASVFVTLYFQSFVCPSCPQECPPAG